MIEIFDEIPQGSDEWLSIRSGMPTASKFADVMAKKGPRGGIPKGRQTYLYKLAGELITGDPMDSYQNPHMERGTEREAEARDLYSFMTGNEVYQVGFIRADRAGCSPDGLIGDDGGLEIKDALAHIQIERLLAGTLPPEHKAQVQGCMMVTGRQWWAFQSHCRGLPPLIVRVERDERYIAELRIAVDEFVEELDALVSKIRGM